MDMTTTATTYKIVRMYESDDFVPEIIKRGLTLAEAQAHCQDPETSSSTCTLAEGVARTQRRGRWFDGYDVDKLGTDPAADLDEVIADAEARGFLDDEVPDGMIRVSVSYAADEVDGCLDFRDQTLELLSWCSGDPAHAAALYLFGYAGAAEAMHMTAEVQ